MSFSVHLSTEQCRTARTGCVNRFSREVTKRTRDLRLTREIGEAVATTSEENMYASCLIVFALIHFLPECSGSVTIAC
jgi:hypothetical protein